ncbi:MAG: glycosyltransferase family 2 protein [Lachnospiraceae bacterium]|nr:glycosyltransferase family 2 protein [Lachnospiraceae bacterium]
MKDKAVSIIVPIYNAEAYLKDCINSVLALNTPNWQLILVNDGSRDASSRICEELCEIDNRIIYIEQENRGVSVARNNGIMKATGEWLTFLDADDMLSSDALKLLDLADDSVDMIIAKNTRGADVNTSKDTYQYLSSQEVQKSILNIEGFKDERKDVTSITEYDHWSSCGRFYRKSVLFENNVKFPVGIEFGEDFLFCMMYAKVARGVIVSDSVIYHYRDNVESVTHKFHKNWPEVIQSQVEIISQHLINDELQSYLNKFIVGRLTELVEGFYADPRSGMSITKSALQLKELMQSNIYIKAISECDYKNLATGKKNTMYSATTLFFLRYRWYTSLICFVKLLRKFLC